MSRYSVRWKKHNLQFRFKAGTSRGFLDLKETWYIMIHDLEEGLLGIGEAGLLKGLSLDDRNDFEEKLSGWCKRIESQLNLYGAIDQSLNIPLELPSIRMGFETAWLDLQHGGIRMIFENDFFNGNKSIPINGLIWMGDMEFMIQQAIDKLEKGFDCIKMKIGAIDFNTELDVLRKIRNQYSTEKVILRVDANGAFHPDEALSKLEALHKLGIHSIEQPIRKGNIEMMKKLCRESPVPIALDEELIGVRSLGEKESLLQVIKPQFIILKPTLLGGFTETREWIELADKSGIGWWITSSLESNIGLNAICQFVAEFENNMHQGLGTGQLYKNNVRAPLEVDDGMIRYRQDNEWNLKLLGV
ncbi:o-succinylbenzoate synthase [Bacteroidota bacterium]